ncbi:MAG TPA: DUF4267 domain-containing protein [Alloacidobacterium sp.]|nr:DUF4267 domain-containing protein [Alloacidobacterium sp.]
MPSNIIISRLLDWIAAAFALILTLIGLIAIADPIHGSALFGMPVTAPGSLAWVRLTGVRDIALGLVLFALLGMKQNRIAGILLLICLIIPFVDVTTVYAQTGWSIHILMHGGSIIFMAIVGLGLLRRK